ncbi:MAG TPA: hypothetical protein VF316_24915 [Polyangiaceae bacterium]
MTRPSTRVFQSLFGILAVAPFAAAALTACESGQADRPPVAPSATGLTSVTASASATVAAVPSSATATIASPPSASSAALPSATPPTVESPPGKVETWGGCPGAAAVGAYIDAHRKCTSDAECSIETTGCGMPGACGVPIQKSAVAGLRVKAQAAVSACMKAGIPLPCATCAPPPPARCGSGYCR